MFPKAYFSPAFFADVYWEPVVAGDGLLGAPPQVILIG